MSRYDMRTWESSRRQEPWWLVPLVLMAIGFLVLGSLGAAIYIDYNKLIKVPSLAEENYSYTEFPPGGLRDSFAPTDAYIDWHNSQLDPEKGQMYGLLVIYFGSLGTTKIYLYEDFASYCEKACKAELTAEMEMIETYLKTAGRFPEIRIVRKGMEWNAQGECIDAGYWAFEFPPGIA